MNVQEPVEYLIETVNDFLKVPEDRIDACLEEFKTCIEMQRAFVGLFSSVTCAVIDEEKPNDAEALKELVMAGGVGARLPYFIWVDDGNKNITVNLSTAEITPKEED